MERASASYTGSNKIVSSDGSSDVSLNRISVDGGDQIGFQCRPVRYRFGSFNKVFEERNDVEVIRPQ